MFLYRVLKYLLFINFLTAAFLGLLGQELRANPIKTKSPAKSRTIGASKIKASTVALANWQGIYGGLSAGSSFGGMNFDFENRLQFDGFGTKGANFGALLGYNFRLADRWVTGVELAAESSDNAMDFSLADNAYDYVKAKATLDREMLLSGRIGYLLTPHTLLYSSVGTEAVHGKAGYSIYIDGYYSGSGSQQSDIYGIYFLSLGLETQLNNRWNTRFEYSEAMAQSAYKGPLGNTGTIASDVGKAKFSLIYNFSEQSVLPEHDHQAIDWQGPYIGGGVGRDKSVSKYDLSPSYSSYGYTLNDLYFDGIASAGWSGNLVAGYNFCFNQKYILGAEGTLSRSSSETLLSLGVNAQHATLDVTNPGSYGGRVRAGYLLWNDFLAYSYLGLSQNKTSVSLTSLGASVLGHDVNYSRQGVDYGGGVETFISKKVSLRLEYGLSQLETVNVVSGSPDYGQLYKINSNASAALLYHF